MIKFIIRQKSFIGLILGFLVILIGSWIGNLFNLSTKQVFIGGFILFTIIGLIPVIFSSSDYDSNLKKIKSLIEQLLKIEDESKRKIILLKKSTKISFDSTDLIQLIKLSKIKDDEFWIDFYLTHITIYNFNKSDFFEFISKFNSEESKKKLEDILISKNWLDKRVSLTEEEKILIKLSYQKFLENLKR